MKTSILFTALLATALFAGTSQAKTPDGPQSAKATAASQKSQKGSDTSTASDTDTSTRSSTASTNSTAAANRLAQRYAQAAGSVDAAANLVSELHTGANGQAALGYGGVDNTLALASKLVADGKATSLQAGVDTVLNLRAENLGWGQVAQQLGYNLGSVVSAAHASGANAAGKASALASGAASQAHGAATQAGQAAQSTASTAANTASTAASSLSAATAGQSASKQTGVDASTSQGSVNVGASTAASASANKAQVERPSMDVRGNGGVNMGIDARPNLPQVRPLLGH